MAQLNDAFLWAYDVKQTGETETLDASQLASPLPEQGYRWVHMQSDAPEAEGMLQDETRHLPVVHTAPM